MIQTQYIASNITIADQTVHVLRQLEFTVLHFQALNKPNGHITLWRQHDVKTTIKIGNIFFLKQDTFFYK